MISGRKLSQSLVALLLLGASVSHAANPNPGAILGNATGFVKGFGLGFMHRSFEPASSLGGGASVFLEANVMQFPVDLINALQAFGLTSFPPAGFNIFPSVKLHVHKGITQQVDLNASGFYIPGSLSPLAIVNIGGDLKVVVWHQEEGPTVAVRLAYTYASYVVTVPTPFTANFPPLVDLPDAKTVATFTTNILAPQVILSKNLGFFDPYIGGGLEYAWGGAGIMLQTGASDPFPGLVDFGSASGAGWSYRFIMGIKFAVPGFRLGFEGSFGSSFTNNYYNGESSSLGMAIGLNY